MMEVLDNPVDPFLAVPPAASLLPRDDVGVPSGWPWCLKPVHSVIVRALIRSHRYLILET